MFSRSGLWYTPRWPPVAIRDVVVADPEGTLRLAAFFGTDLQATPVQILRWVVMRWAVEVTFEEARAHLGVETQRQWSEQAIARTTPVLLAVFSLVTVWALQVCHGGPSPVPVTAWYHKAEPTFSDGLTRGRRQLWRAQYVVHSTPEAESMQWPPGVLDLLRNGLPLADSLAKVEFCIPEYMLAYRRYVQALYGPERLPEERPKQGKEASRVRTITA